MAGPRSSTLILSALALAGCPRKPQTPPPDATTQGDASAIRANASNALSTAPPDNLLATIRGAMLRRAVPMIFPGPEIEQVITQGVPQLTRGVGANASRIDLDSPFAVVAVLGESEGDGEGATPTFLAAWPLKPGASVTVDAREGRGWTSAGQGVYRPTSPDAGANDDHQCWVARRQPVGWSLLCGPKDLLPRVAGYLVHVGTSAPDNQAIVDADIRAGILGRIFRRQLAEIDRRAPPTGGRAPEEQLRRQAFEQARRQIALTSAIATDIDAVRGALTQDESSMHLSLTATVSRASSDQVRFLIDAAAGRQAPADLLTSLPSSTQAWMVSGFDPAKIATALGAPSEDIMIRAQVGPEFARVKMLIEQVTSVMPPGHRVDAYTPDEGHTMIRVIQRADAERFVDDFRVAVQSIPSRQIGPGVNLRDQAVVMPVTGITGHVLRIGQNIRIPPGTQITPEQREELNRSLLLVGQGDRLTVVQGRDPVARYRAWTAQASQRLSATIPANSVMSGRINMASFGPFFYGQAIGGLPEGGAEGVDFSLSVARQGEGATITLRADGPTVVATGLRRLYAFVEQQRAAAMQQQLEAMQRAQQQQQQQMQQLRQMQQNAQRQQLDPNNLPEPPSITLPQR
ncbi:MAG: hypothetical protein JNK05_29350 [Myxococcales bacterium]|nr:hypothetical protein [Myxococcales bacterium]